MSCCRYTRFVGSFTGSSSREAGGAGANGLQLQGPPPVVAVQLQQAAISVIPEPLGPDDVPPPPPHPTDPDEIRRLMRSKMHRCKRCKNRFVERNLLERHLKERHIEDYIEYMEEQVLIDELGRLA